MPALTRTLSALGGRTARRTAILATAPLLAASGVAFMPAQAAPGWVGLEAFGAAEGMPDTAAVCGSSCASLDRTAMTDAAALPPGSVAVFTVIGKVTSFSATEFHVNVAPGTDVTLYAAAGTRLRNTLASQDVVKVIAARPATAAPAPL